MTERLRLGDMLVAAGLVTETQVQEALAMQRTTGKRLGETLVAMGTVNEGQMTQVLSNQLSIPWANLYHVDFSRELLELVPAKLAERYRIIPVYMRHVRRQGDTLFVAMDDPLNLDALQLVADACGMPVKPMVASPSDIENAIRVYYLGLPPMGPKAKAIPAAEAPPELAQELVDAAPNEEPDTEQMQAADWPEARVGADPAPSPEPEPEPAAPEPPKIEPPEPAPAERVLEAQPEASPPAPREPERPEGRPSAPARREAQASPEPKIDPRAARFLTLTLLDGTQVRLPGSRKEAKPEPSADRGLTTRDLIHALTARAAGEDVSGVLPDDAWEPLLATLLSVLMRKGIVADWEFVDEWKKHRKKKE